MKPSDLHSAGTVRPRSGLRSSALMCAVLCVGAVAFVSAAAGDTATVVVAGIALAGVGAVAHVAVVGRTPATIGPGTRLVGRAGVVLLAVAVAAAVVAGSAQAIIFLLMALALGVVVLASATRPLPAVSQKSRDRLADLERRRDERRGPTS